MPEPPPISAPSPGEGTRPSAAAPSGTVLAFDFGERRIGVAVGETGPGIAHALEVIDTREDARRFERIAALIEQWRPALLVVGRPAHLDGTAHELTARCERFARRLHGRYGLPVRTIDERLSSWDAQSRLRELGAPAKRARSRLDAAAAQLLLQSWFDGTA